MLKIKTKYDYRAELCEALRSGKYIKTDAICALSVYSIINGHGPHLCDIAYMPAAVNLGLDSASDIWYRNDGSFGHRVHSFSEIADYIESLP